MSIKDIPKTLLTKYNKHTNTERPFIVGVDGLGGAGKTTFVHRLRDTLGHKGINVVTLHIDDHIVESNKRYGTRNEEWYEYYFLQWDIKLLQTELFHKLRQGEKMVNLPYYDRVSDIVASKKVYIASDSIVFVEGIFIQRHEWRDYFDFVIFIDSAPEVRKKRVLDRDLYIGDYQKRLEKYEKRYWIAEEQYMRMEKPLEKADIIISGDFI